MTSMNVSNQSPLRTGLSWTWYSQVLYWYIYQQNTYYYYIWATYNRKLMNDEQVGTLRVEKLHHYYCPLSSQSRSGAETTCLVTTELLLWAPSSFVFCVPFCDTSTFSTYLFLRCPSSALLSFLPSYCAFSRWKITLILLLRSSRYSV